RGPEDQGPEDQGPRDPGPRDQGPADQGPRDPGPRHQGPEDPGPRDEGPRLLPIPGEVTLGPEGLAVGAEVLPGTSGADERPRKWAARGMEVAIAAGAVELPLAVRTRRPGDRFRPLGAP